MLIATPMRSKLIDTLKNIFSKPAILWILLLFIIYSGAILYPRSIDSKGKIHAGPDPKTIMWAMSWVHYQLLEDPLNLYRANIYYPHTTSLAHSDTELVPSLTTLPFRVFTDEPTVLFNLAFWIAFALSGFGMFLLVRYLTGRVAIAVIAGILFAFSPFRLDNLTHLQYASQEWLPFVVLSFLKFFKGREKKWAFAAAAFLWLQAMSCITYFVMLSIPLALFVVLLWLRFPLDRRLALWLIASGLALVICLAPFLYPTWHVTREIGLEPDLNMVLIFTPDLLDFFKQPKYMTSPVYSLLPGPVRTPYFSPFPGFLATCAMLFSLGLLFTIQPTAPTKKDEKFVLVLESFRIGRTALLIFASSTIVLLTWQALFLPPAPVPFQAPPHPPAGVDDGFNLLTALLWLTLLAWAACAAIATLAARKGMISWRDSLIWIFLFLAFLSGLFTLGPLILVKNWVVGQNVYWPIFKFVPGFGTVRMIMYFNTFLILFGVSAAGIALKRIELLPRAATVAVLIGLFIWIGFEYQTNTAYNRAKDSRISENSRNDWVEVALEVPEMYRWLATEPKESPFIELRVAGPPYHQAADKMYWSIYHKKPLVNGLFSYPPKEYDQLVKKTASFPSRESIEYIQDSYKLKYVVVRKRDYSLEQLEKAVDLFKKPWSDYKFHKDFKYFLVFRNQRWKDSMFYAFGPPAVRQ